MKKMLMTLMAMLTITVSATAMSFEQARREALFLTDKMAYELNLTDEQYEACYEINLDYLMGVTGRADVFGVYWERRNLDMSYILLDWQWNAFLAASYFYRPLYWEAGYWHFGIYARYSHRDYFYFGTPAFYVSYRGGHAWHIHGDRGYYYGHREHFRAPRREHIGMHDRWNRGDFRSNRSSTRVTNRPEGRGRIGNGGRIENRGRNDRSIGRPESGTRRTENGVGRTPERRSENNGVRNRQVEGHRNFGSDRQIGSPSNSSSPSSSSSPSTPSIPSSSVGSGSSSRPSSIGSSSSRPSRDFGSSSSSSTSNRSVGSHSATPSRSFGNSSSSRPSSSVSRPSSSSSSSPSRSFGSSSAPSRSIGSSAPSRSVGSSSHSAPSRSAGGHVGGRR